MALKITCIKIPEDIIEKLDQMAVEKRTTRSELIREALRLYLKKTDKNKTITRYKIRRVVLR